jgi:WD40 repeat protein
LQQVITVSQDGTMHMWLIESGQKIKSMYNLHDSNEVTTLDFDEYKTKFYTASTDGNIKVFEKND